MRATRAMVRWAYDPGTENRRFYPAIPNKASLLNGYISGASKHATGYAVDLTIVPGDRVIAAFDPGANYGPCTGPAAQRSPDSSIDMGTGYDCFDTLSHTNSPGISEQHRKSRGALIGVMSQRG